MGDSRWSGARSSEGDCGGAKEQERLLPIANEGRIMRKMLPPNAKISKEARETMQESVSEFIGFVTAEAADKCREARRKTLTGDDICAALGCLGMDHLADATRMFLKGYMVSEDERAETPMGSSAIARDQELDLFGIYPCIDNQASSEEHPKSISDPNLASLDLKQLIPKNEDELGESSTWKCDDKNIDPKLETVRKDAIGLDEYLVLDVPG